MSALLAEVLAVGQEACGAFRHPLAAFRFLRRTLAAFAAFAMCLMRLGKLRETAGPVPSAKFAEGGGSTSLWHNHTGAGASATPGVDVSKAAEAGLAAAVSLRRQERWLAENKPRWRVRTTTSPGVVCR